MKNLLSIIIPAQNEDGVIVKTVLAFHSTLKTENIKHEIIVINDGSTDQTAKVLKEIKLHFPILRVINNPPPHGFGLAVRLGLKKFTGDYVAIVMADLSDKPQDLIKYFKKALEGYDCVFGSRFVRGAKVRDYPIHKLILNRITNNIIKLLFFIRYNDVTNAFKLYSKETIKGLTPLFSHGFNLTVELPLKSIVRGYSYAVVPTDWSNRKKGVSKLKIKEMGSRYFFIIFYCWLEKILSMGDYKKKLS